MKKNITTQQLSALAQASADAKKYSYSPYSHFKVGAAVLTENGQMYTGTNIENASYGLTVCAERNAMFKAACEGHRRFTALAVCTDPVPGQDFGTPCGACLQVMTEFMKPDAIIMLVAVDKKGKITSCKKKLKNFMPYAFVDF